MRYLVSGLVALALVVPAASGLPIVRYTDEDAVHHVGLATQDSEDHDEDWLTEAGGCVQAVMDHEYTFSVEDGAPEVTVSLTVTSLWKEEPRTVEASPGETITFTVTHVSGCHDFVVRGEDVTQPVAYDVTTRQIGLG